MELLWHQFLTSFIIADCPAALLHFDPGTGKTATAIEAMRIRHYRDGLRYVIVVPAFLIRNWQAELKMWWPQITVSVEGYKGKPADKSATVILVSYDRMKKVEASIAERKAIVFDESHYLNGDSQRSKYAREVCDTGFKHAIFLTGTPIMNRVVELYNVMWMLDKISPKGFRKVYSSHTKFNEAFSLWRDIPIPGKAFPARQYYGIRNESVLKKWTGLWFIRVTREQCIQLPDIVEEYIDVEGINDKLQDALSKLWELSPTGIIPKEFEGDTVGEHISSAKACAAQAKAGTTAEFAGTITGPVVIFTDHVQAAKDMARMLERGGKTSCCITGETSIALRATYVDRFQRGEIDFFVATIGSCGVGINLTKGCNVIINDLSWVPARNEQAIARVYRYGQANPVTVYTMVGGRIDTKIAKLLREKMTIIRTMEEKEREQ